VIDLTRTSSVPARRSPQLRLSSRVTTPRKPRPRANAPATSPTSRLRARRGPIRGEPSASILIDRKRIPGVCPDERVARGDDDPGADAERKPGGADAVAPKQRRDHGRSPQEGGVDDRGVNDQREQPGDEPDGAHRLGTWAPDHPPHHALEQIVEPAGDLGDLAAEVTDQAHAMGGDRRPDLRRLGDPLDRLLDLVGGEQPVPDAVDQLGVEHLKRRALDRGAGERPAERLLGLLALEHPEDRALDRRTLQRPDDRLLGGSLGDLVEPGGAGDGPRGTSPGAQQPSWQWRALALGRWHGASV
jgi:hypothetical protein